ncbi:Sec-independent protein translocase subunit TatB [Streptomyces glomeratus]|uniref:Sec-independent protein translocase protein TatB n=1 Tax=Streptomyces glomeratus TaxID=284452 RepID=A0ABP6M7P7_9ACTN|nr:Sec-independent protein translocase subunit TatB [Streptomyces glomeratus]MCF1510455.1 Sec-independent protein translocase subunit TatB [Streptomyces glomeratus]
MFFDIGPLEIVTLLVLAVILLGPEKLPTTVSTVARNMRRLREFLQSTQADIRAELPPEMQGMALDDLNPKSLVRKHLLSAEDLNLSEPASGSGPERELLGNPAANTSQSPKRSVGSGPVPAAVDDHHEQQQSTQRTATNH